MRSSRRSIAALLLLLAATLAPGCMIVRVTRGSPIEGDPAEVLEEGVTDRGGVLEAFGAPDHVFRQQRGDVFVYRYTKEDTDAVLIEEPVITNMMIFSYTRGDERQDRLVVVFDEAGVVESFGVLRGATGE